MPHRIRVNLAGRWSISISNVLDEAGLTPHEQLLCLLSACSIAMSELPPEEMSLVRAAHIAALDKVIAEAGG